MGKERNQHCLENLQNHELKRSWYCLAVRSERPLLLVAGCKLDLAIAGIRLDFLAVVLLLGPLGGIRGVVLELDQYDGHVKNRRLGVAQEPLADDAQVSHPLRCPGKQSAYSGQQFFHQLLEHIS